MPPPLSDFSTDSYEVFHLNLPIFRLYREVVEGLVTLSDIYSKPIRGRGHTHFFEAFKPQIPLLTAIPRTKTQLFMLIFGLVIPIQGAGVPSFVKTSQFLFKLSLVPSDVRSIKILRS